ncbi:MAG: energy-coupling factor transporter transmembrane protein EcfT [Clostridia bacterium]|nr:energy-coupling factor transporter transmembrane protein EcfT [Clostridia bacterium]
MLNNITMGQYYPVDSRVHRLDPRIKLILTIAFIVAVFLAHSFVGYVILAGFLFLSCRLACVPFRLLLKGLKPLRMIIILTFLLNLFFTPGDDVWVSFWIVRITREAFLQALFYSLRLVFLVAGTSLLTLTTSPIALSDGIELLLTPLKKIHFPAHELAMMMTIALRFIPTLLEETDKIMKAQMARGADFESGNLLSRARAMVPLLVPLFVSAFRRAGDLALAMESRCYHGGEGRTRLRVLKITRSDWIACGVLAVLLGLIILEGIVLKGVLF